MTHSLKNADSSRSLSTIAELLVNCMKGLFLLERDYVTFGSLLSQIRLSVIYLSVVCNVRAPYSGG